LLQGHLPQVDQFSGGIADHLNAEQALAVRIGENFQDPVTGAGDLCAGDFLWYSGAPVVCRRYDLVRCLCRLFPRKS